MIAGLPFFLFSLQAMEVESLREKETLKRDRPSFEDGYLADTEEDPPLKKIKKTLKTHSVGNPVVQFYPHVDCSDYDIWKCIGSFVSFSDFTSLLCVNKKINESLKSGEVQTFLYAFEKPISYVNNLMRQYPHLKLVINIVNSTPQTLSERLDFVIETLNGNFSNRIDGLFLVDSSSNINIIKFNVIFSLIINSETILLKKFVMQGGPSYLETDLTNFLNSKSSKNIKSLCLAISLLPSLHAPLDLGLALMQNIEQTHCLDYLSFNHYTSDKIDMQFHFGSLFFDDFAVALSKNHSLNTINLRGCYFKLEQVSYILKVMELANSTLTTLILDKNLFGLEGISRILQKNKDLVETKMKGLSSLSLIDISQSGPPEVNAIYERFLQALECNNGLKTLNLGCSELFLPMMQEPFFPKVLVALSKSKTLTQLSLHSHLFRQEDQQDILLFFQKSSRSLQQLNLVSCFNLEVSNDFFIECLYQNTLLHELKLDQKTVGMFGEENWNLIERILDRNLQSDIKSMRKRFGLSVPKESPLK